MTREEKQKAIDTLKISAPIMALTQEEFKDYIQTLNKIMDWLEQAPTTKNDLPHCQHTDEEIARSFIEDVEAVKDQLPTTKNNLGVDCISRKYIYNRLHGLDHDEDYECDEYGGSKITYHTCDWDEVLREIEDAPSVTPQEPRKGYLSIDDVMSVFDDFMCGEVDEDGTETFWEMLKDKAESEK